MSNGIQFEEESFRPNQVFNDPTATGGMSAWLQKQGIVKSEKGANSILILIIVVLFGFAGYLYATEFNKPSNNDRQEALSEEILQLPENDFKRRAYEGRVGNN